MIISNIIFTLIYSNETRRIMEAERLKNTENFISGWLQVDFPAANEILDAAAAALRGKISVTCGTMYTVITAAVILKGQCYMSS
jgi:hypothetical protein